MFQMCMFVCGNVLMDCILNVICMVSVPFANPDV